MTGTLTLSEILQPLEAELSRVEDLVMQNLETDIPLLTEVGQYILKAGGKRVRPAMLLFAAGAVGKITDSCCQAANIIEYIHTATLLHDDVVDHAELRRNKKSARSIWGNEASVLVGDYLFTVSFKYMAQLGMMELVDALSRTTTLMARGEILQLTRSNETASEADYLEIVYHKTATLMATAMQMGAILVGADKVTSDLFYQIGKDMGMAFQVIDDTLDYQLGNQGLGKEQGTDLKERKITLPLSRLIAISNEADQEVILDILDEDTILDSHVEQIVALIEKYEVVPYCISRAEAYIQSAQENVKKFPQNKYTQSIIQLADFVVSRCR